MNRTEITFLDHTFKNPVIAASGTYGYGEDYRRYYKPEILGGIALKGLTLEPRAGNKGIRLWETPSGVLNSIGLQNPGLDVFARKVLPKVVKLGKKTEILVNIAGHRSEDYMKVLDFFKDYPEFLYELNLSCPNVDDGMAFGSDPDEAYKLIKKLRRNCELKLIVKLTPNCPSITEVALAVEEAGADALSMINTIQGFAVDYRRKKIPFDNVYAGLSGPAIKPIALKMVFDTAQVVKIPIIGIGGIRSATDVIEYLLAGATLVQVGTANFNNPRAMKNIIEDLEKYCRKTDERCADLVGSLQL